MATREVNFGEVARPRPNFLETKIDVARAPAAAGKLLGTLGGPLAGCSRDNHSTVATPPNVPIMSNEDGDIEAELLAAGKALDKV